MRQLGQDGIHFSIRSGVSMGSFPWLASFFPARRVLDIYPFNKLAPAVAVSQIHRHPSKCLFVPCTLSPVPAQAVLRPGVTQALGLLPSGQTQPPEMVVVIVHGGFQFGPVNQSPVALSGNLAGGIDSGGYLLCIDG